MGLSVQFGAGGATTLILLMRFCVMDHYDMFRSRYPPKAHPHLDAARRFCLSLGDSVIEDVREHRLVYGKSMIQRWFADIYPDTDSIRIKTSRGWRHPPTIDVVSYTDDISEILAHIQDAYRTIR